MQSVYSWWGELVIIWNIQYGYYYDISIHFKKWQKHKTGMQTKIGMKTYFPFHGKHNTMEIFYDNFRFVLKKCPTWLYCYISKFQTVQCLYCQHVVYFKSVISFF